MTAPSLNSRRTKRSLSPLRNWWQGFLAPVSLQKDINDSLYQHQFGFKKKKKKQSIPTLAEKSQGFPKIGNRFCNPYLNLEKMEIPTRRIMPSVGAVTLLESQGLHNCRIFKKKDQNQALKWSFFYTQEVASSGSDIRTPI